MFSCVLLSCSFSTDGAEDPGNWSLIIDFRRSDNFNFQFNCKFPKIWAFRQHPKIAKNTIVIPFFDTQNCKRISAACSIKGSNLACNSLFSWMIRLKFHLECMFPISEQRAIWEHSLAVLEILPYTTKSSKNSGGLISGIYLNCLACFSHKQETRQAPFAISRSPCSNNRSVDSAIHARKQAIILNVDIWFIFHIWTIHCVL